MSLVKINMIINIMIKRLNVSDCLLIKDMLLHNIIWGNVIIMEEAFLKIRQKQQNGID